jgi:HK97 gp10 family phage protein
MAGAFQLRLDQAALTRLLEGPEGPVGKDLARRAVKVDRAAKNHAPVDTGRLRSSINWRIARDSQGLVGIVGTNVEYAIHQEFGTRFQSGTPFLRPALSAAGS